MGGLGRSWRWGAGWILKYIVRADSQTFSKMSDLLELQYLHKGFS